MKRPAKVLIIQWVIKHYREPFYNGLFEDLKDQNIELRVLYSEPNTTEKLKNDNIELSREYSKRVPSYWFFKEKLIYQHAIKDILWADYIVVEQANKHIINPVLLLLNLLKLKHVAFWGHGYNRQGTSTIIEKFVLKKLSKNVSWWFAYTGSAAKYLEDIGYTKDQITTVNNSIDGEGFRRSLAEIQSAKIDECLNSIGAQKNSPIALFCGSFYQHKRLKFLFEISDLIYKKMPDFRLVLIGAGPQSEMVSKLCNERPEYAYCTGSLKGAEKAIWYKIADIQLNPGLVGLAIIDGFVAGLPMVTADIPIHSPEIDYLIRDVNGLILPYDAELFSSEVCALFSDNTRLIHMKVNAEKSGRKYSMRNMIRNFSSGLSKWFEASK